MLASAILARIMASSGKRFHITYSEPLITIDKINFIRQQYDSSTLVLVGLDTIGTTRIKKGSSYPIIIGGESESEQAGSFRLGTNLTLTAVAYLLAEQSQKRSDYDLQLAVSGALLSKDIEKSTKDANNDIINLAVSENIVEERKGFRLLGVSMLPLDEVFLYCTYPYLKTLSGNQKACDSLLNEAEIPVPKLRTPLSNLNTTEAQRLTSKLIPRLDPLILPRLLGTDFEFLKERQSSPFRHLSGLEIISSTAWTINELGALMSILLGDRGRALRLLLDSHLSHHKDVISSIHRLETGLVSESTTSATILKTHGYRIELLPDIGRIAIETGIVDTDRPVALDHDDAFIIVWPSRNLSLNDVSQRFLQEKIDLNSTAKQSIRIANDSKITEKALQIISDMNKESG